MIEGLHHITATVGEAKADLHYYTRLLGLRLVKKTVNFDDPEVFHFYYGNEQGAPGTIFTTFPYAGRQVRRGLIGNGQVVASGLSIPRQAADQWRRQLETAGFGASTVERFDQVGVRVSDPSGLLIELMEAPEDQRLPYTDGPVDISLAIRGLHHVLVSVANGEETARFLVERLGFELHQVDGNYTRLSVGQASAGHYIDIRHAPQEPKGRNGIGTVHHVAWRVLNDEVLRQIQGILRAANLNPTDIKDRNYFHSVYCRIPGGILFEFATIPPGFAIDEAPDQLGQELKLPEWEEVNRSQIEQALPQL